MLTAFIMYKEKQKMELELWHRHEAVTYIGGMMFVGGLSLDPTMSNVCHAIGPFTFLSVAAFRPCLFLYAELALFLPACLLDGI